MNQTDKNQNTPNQLTENEMILNLTGLCLHSPEGTGRKERPPHRPEEYNMQKPDRMQNQLTEKEMKQGIRKSRMCVGEIYFWTDTIKDWQNLLQVEPSKKIIMACWQELVYRKKIKIYGFVIMPNHIHILWEMLEKNGKEMPHASFNKFTSHQFLRFLRIYRLPKIKKFKVDKAPERNHRFWQRDPLAVRINSQEMFEQKLEYIHLNPLQKKWNLVTRPEDYTWSSAKFYETREDNFGILTDYRERY